MATAPEMREARALARAEAPDPPLTSAKAYLNELFLSFQGEGVLAGTRQMFLRLAGCDIRCPWCDTPDALTAKGSRTFRIETAPGAAWRERPNPLGPSDVLEEVRAMRAAHGPCEWISLTGGEPTIWRRFLEALCPALRAEGLKVFLETNSHHPDTLKALSGSLDFVSADIKLPLADYEIGWETYEAFVAAIPPAAGQVKVVVLAGLDPAEVEEAARRVGAIDRRLPLILQPVSPVGGAEPPAWTALLAHQARCLLHLDDVRIIPQLHKALDAR